MNPFLDRKKHVDIRTGGNLPHWQQNGKIQFITFRLADSLPQSKIRELKTCITNFKNEHPLPWSDATKLEYRNITGQMEKSLLDNGYGSCLLQYVEFRQIVVSSINYYSSQLYDVAAFVIMPNHVHLLLHFYPETITEKVLHSIKSFTAHQINVKRQQFGTVWMSEYFDRIVRSRSDLQNYIDYIENNPRNLNPDKFTLYVNPDWR